VRPVVITFDEIRRRLLSGRFWENEIEFNFKIAEVPALPILYIYCSLTFPSPIALAIGGCSSTPTDTLFSISDL
jgi:hypothetical protein